jgi:enamine deaminase RidA (YjgF/YER057c/UK114 family)
MNERIDPGWPRYARYTFPPAVRRGNLLFVSGMTAVDDDGNLVGEGDIAAQARYIYQRLGEILAAAGASYADVVKTTDYITTTEGYRQTAEVRREVFGATFPAATGVIVAGLLRPGALIEIEAIAVVPESSSTITTPQSS